jgi:Large polyvalent protein associated domain 29
MIEVEQGRVEYLSVAETAKLVRVALAKAFPGFTFRVRSDSYAGGASIDVSWMDGPTTKEVDKVVGGFSGKGFDGMIDLAYYTTAWLEPDGTAHLAGSPGTEGSRGSVPEHFGDAHSGAARLVSMGADYVHTSRSLSAEASKMIERQIEVETGVPFDAQAQYPDHPLAYGGHYCYGSDLIHRMSSMTAFPAASFTWSVYRYSGYAYPESQRIVEAEGLTSQTAAEKVAKAHQKARFGDARGFRYVEAHRA